MPFSLVTFIYIYIYIYLTLLKEMTVSHSARAEKFAKDKHALIYIFSSSYNVWKHVRYPALISRQPGW